MNSNLAHGFAYASNKDCSRSLRIHNITKIGSALRIIGSVSITERELSVPEIESPKTEEDNQHVFVAYLSLVIAGGTNAFVGRITNPILKLAHGTVHLTDGTRKTIASTPTTGTGFMSDHSGTISFKNYIAENVVKFESGFTWQFQFDIEKHQSIASTRLPTKLRALISGTRISRSIADITDFVVFESTMNLSEIRGTSLIVEYEDLALIEQLLDGTYLNLNSLIVRLDSDDPSSNTIVIDSRINITGSLIVYQKGDETYDVLPRSIPTIGPIIIKGSVGSVSIKSSASAVNVSSITIDGGSVTSSINTNTSALTFGGFKCTNRGTISTGETYNVTDMGLDDGIHISDSTAGCKLKSQTSNINIVNSTVTSIDNELDSTSGPGTISVVGVTAEDLRLAMGTATQVNCSVSTSAIRQLKLGGSSNQTISATALQVDEFLSDTDSDLDIKLNGPSSVKTLTMGVGYRNTIEFSGSHSITNIMDDRSGTFNKDPFTIKNSPQLTIGNMYVSDWDQYPFNDDPAENDFGNSSAVQIGELQIVANSDNSKSAGSNTLGINSASINSLKITGIGTGTFKPESLKLINTNLSSAVFDGSAGSYDDLEIELYSANLAADFKISSPPIALKKADPSNPIKSTISISGAPVSVTESGSLDDDTVLNITKGSHVSFKTAALPGAQSLNVVIAHESIADQNAITTVEPRDGENFSILSTLNNVQIQNTQGSVVSVSANQVLNVVQDPNNILPTPDKFYTVSPQNDTNMFLDVDGFIGAPNLQSKLYTRTTWGTNQEFRFIKRNSKWIIIPRSAMTCALGIPGSDEYVRTVTMLTSSPSAYEWTIEPVGDYIIISDDNRSVGFDGLALFSIFKTGLVMNQLVLEPTSTAPFMSDPATVYKIETGHDSTLVLDINGFAMENGLGIKIHGRTGWGTNQQFKTVEVGEYWRFVSVIDEKYAIVHDLPSSKLIMWHIDELNANLFDLWTIEPINISGYYQIRCANNQYIWKVDGGAAFSYLHTSSTKYHQDNGNMRFKFTQ